MFSNRLKLNANTTQFIWLGSGPMLSKLDEFSLSVDGTDVLPVAAVRDLGLTLTMKPHMVIGDVDLVVRCCFCELRQLRSVCRSLTDDANRSLRLSPVQ